MTTDASPTGNDEPTNEPYAFPPEVAAILILIGVAGLPLPGPGLPFIVAGGLVLWPKTFQPIDRNIQAKFPDAHSSVCRILHRFETDLYRRYPRG